jgi:hypothetical protein
MLFSNAGKSYRGKGMVCVTPVITTNLAPSESMSLSISVAIRKSGIVLLPLTLRLLGTVSGVTLEWNYIIQAEGEVPQINDYVFSIMDNEELHCLLPIQQNQGHKLLNALLQPVVPSSAETESNDDVLRTVLMPIRPMCWNGIQNDRMTGLMRIPEPSMPLGVSNLQFKRQFDGRESLRFSDSISKEEKKEMMSSVQKKSTRLVHDQMWKSLRSNSRTGMY